MIEAQRPKGVPIDLAAEPGRSEILPQPQHQPARLRRPALTLGYRRARGHEDDGNVNDHFDQLDLKIEASHEQPDVEHTDRKYVTSVTPISRQASATVL